MIAALDIDGSARYGARSTREIPRGAPAVELSPRAAAAGANDIAAARIDIASLRPGEIAALDIDGSARYGARSTREIPRGAPAVELSPRAAAAGANDIATAGIDIALLRPGEVGRRPPLASDEALGLSPSGLVVSLALHGLLAGALLIWSTKVAQSPPPEPIVVEIVIESSALEAPPPVAEAPPPPPPVEAVHSQPVAEAVPPVAEAPPPPPAVEAVRSQPLAEALPPVAEAPPPPPPVEAARSQPVAEALPPVAARPLEPAPEPTPAPARAPSVMPTPVEAARSQPVAEALPPVAAHPLEPAPERTPAPARKPFVRPTPTVRAPIAPQKPARAAPAPAASSAEAAAYQGAVLARIAARKHYPEAALERGPHGVAVIAFAIDPTGQVVGAELAQSAGDPILDADAVSTVRRAGPFPPPPAGAPRRFTASLNYRAR